MKRIFLVLSFCFAAMGISQAQIVVSDRQAELTMTQLLTPPSTKVEGAVTSKIRTIETVVQTHDGQAVYQTVREVEYTFKESAKKISRKRKVLSTTTERLSADSNLEEIYPDVTSVLMSGVFTPKSVQKQENAFKMSFLVTTDDAQNTTSVLFDKLGVMQSHGLATTDQLLGSQIRYDVITEELQYGTLSPRLYLDQLQRVTCVMALTSTEKSGTSHRVKITENIEVKSVKLP